MEEPFLTRWSRRSLTLSVYAVAWVVLFAALPVLLLLALAGDAAWRRHLAASRFLLFLAVYLTCEVAGLFAAAAVWVPYAVRALGRERFLDLCFRLQCRWASVLFGAARVLYRLELRVEGRDRVTPGPLLLFMRHASLIDALLPAALVSARTGVRLRYVLKRELLLDPCLDVVGQRLPNVFVRRDGRDSAREIAAVRALARDLSRNEGVLIYPEGTRFTPAKRSRALERLRQSGAPSLAERAARLRCVLPPRLGGPLALLEACPEADVVFCAHVGLDGLARPRDLWDASLLGRRLRVRFTRIPASAVPKQESERIDWLYARWEELDHWIEAARRESLAR